MMGRRTATLALAFALTAASGASLFAQTYSFGTPVPSSPSGSYSWQGTTQIPITAYINYNSTTKRFLFWDYSPAVGSRNFSYNGNTIPYSVYKYISSIVGNELWAWSQTPTTANVFSVTTTGTKLSNSPLYFIVIPASGYLKPAGTYTTTVTIGYYTGTLNGTTITNATLRTSQAIGVSLVNPAVCDLSVVSTSGSFDVNTTSQNLQFGDVTTATNPSLSAKAIVRSNATSWSLSAQSTNGGNIVTGSYTIPYTMTYNGSTVPLVQGSTTKLEDGTWASTVDGYAERVITITLGSTFVEPGSYSDTISLTMTYNG